MVSTMQQHEHCLGASHATCSKLTRALCAVLSAGMHAAVDALQKH